MRTLIYLTSASLLTLFIILTILVITTPLYQETLPAHVKVDKYIGINLDTDKVYFGTITPGNTGTRGVTLTSGEERFVIITTSGDAGEWITTTRKTFTITRGEEKAIPFTITIPPDAPNGEYNATIHFTFYRPLLNYFIP